MLFEGIGVLDEHFDYQENQWVGIKEGRFAYIGSEPPADAESYGERYDGAERLLMPALYNAHAHVPMTLLRGYAENLPLQAWLSEKCWPFEAKITPEDIYWATLLSCAELSRYGAVSYTDMYYAADERARATVEAGMKANLCEGILAFEDKPYAEYAVCQRNEHHVEHLHGSDEGRILIDYCIHGEYTSNERVCSDIIAIVKEKGLRLHIHLSESQSEVAECRERHGGLSPVEYFEQLGAFDVPVLAAHCVWVDDNDIDILVNCGVFVASCPASNMKLGSGFAPIPKMLERGVAVCLGTDGMASNNNHDMFQDMYLLALSAKGAHLDPTAVEPREALKAATRAGALSQGREDCGLVKVGMKADLCVLDTSGPQWWPMTDPVCNVVYAGSGSDVVLTMCDGRVVYRDGVWPGIDIECVKHEVAKRTARIISELRA